MKNTENTKLKRLSKVNAIYLLALSIFTVYFVMTEFTYEKALFMLIGLTQGAILLMAEIIKINKS